MPKYSIKEKDWRIEKRNTIFLIYIFSFSWNIEKMLKIFVKRKEKFSSFSLKNLVVLLVYKMKIYLNYWRQNYFLKLKWDIARFSAWQTHIDEFIIFHFPSSQCFHTVWCYWEMDWDWECYLEIKSAICDVCQIRGVVLVVCRMIYDNHSTRWCVFINELYSHH